MFHASRNNMSLGDLAFSKYAELERATSAIGMQHLTAEDGYPVHLNLQAKYLVVAPKLSIAARMVTNFTRLNDENDLIVRQESRLSSLGVVNPKNGTVYSGADLNWLMCAASTSHPSVVVGGLNGKLTPQVRS
ncbi:MAG: hypothetical protein ABI645_16420, partial [Pseudomonadota bacterium]